MENEINCADCIYSEETKDKLSIETEYQKKSRFRIKCTIGYRVTREGKPGSGCNGMFFEPKN